MHTSPVIQVSYPTAGFVSCVNQHHLLVNYLHDVKDILQVYELSTGQLVRDLPLEVGTVSGVSCRKKHSDFFYKFTSFTTPGILVIPGTVKKIFSVLYTSPQIHPWAVWWAYDQDHSLNCSTSLMKTWKQFFLQMIQIYFAVMKTSRYGWKRTGTGKEMVWWK